MVVQNLPLFILASTYLVLEVLVSPARYPGYSHSAPGLKAHVSITLPASHLNRALMSLVAWPSSADMI